MHMSLQSNYNRIVVVLGMHRSGTSAMARALQALDVDLGERLYAGIPNNNEKGFYEDVDVNRLDNELMAALGRRWDSLAPIDPPDLERDAVASFRQRAVGLLRDRVKDRPFGLKDPRISKLLPFWKSVFSQAGLEPCYVIAVRNPLGIVHSLKNRDGFDAEKSYHLWLEHILPMLSETAEAKRVVVDFDELLAVPAAQLKRIADALDLPFLEQSPAVREYIEEFLDDDLRHTRFGLEDLRRDPAASPDVIATYELMSKLARDQTAFDAPEVSGQVERLEEKLHTFAPALRYMDRCDDRIAGLDQAVVARDGQIAGLNQTVAARDGQITGLNQTVAARDSQITGLNQAVAERCRQIDDLNQAVAGCDRQIAGLNQTVALRDGRIAGLNQAVAERDEQIAALLGSNSWRITKPLRFMSRLLRGDKHAVGRSLAHWGRQQKSRYEIVKARRPIWAALRYGVFVWLASGKSRLYLKRLLGQYSSPGDALSMNPPADGGFVPVPLSQLRPYSSEYQGDEDFSALRTDIKAVAFYLPQFHSIKENDEWWGDGFTEWTNTRQAGPRFAGHYQPREPHDDIGYYDLSNIETLRQQAALARRHGIHGFCFYYYWFSGRRLLEKPVDLLLQHPEIDINFCLCWANENWTRTWDGMHDNVLVSQKHSSEDAVNFIRDLKRYIEDPRYIHIDGKPVIMVYKPHIIPDVEKVFGAWRQWWRDNTGGELEIWCNRTNFSDTACEDLKDAIDAVVEFPPHVVPYEIEQSCLGLDTTGHFYDYQGLLADIMGGTERTKTPSVPFYRTAMLGWDNAARRKDGWSVWYGFSLEAYYRWLRHIIAYTRKSFPRDRRFVFINAWNEWAEGTYLEPDRKFGYASINTSSRAIFDLPFRRLPRVLGNTEEVSVAPAQDRLRHTQDERQGVEAEPHGKPVGSALPLTPRVTDDSTSGSGSIAVHVHLFFDELANEMLGYVNHIPYPFDLFVTTDTEQKAATFERLFRQDGLQTRLEVVVVPNVGRDVAPFLVGLGDRLSNYEYIGHFHGKKSTTVDWGGRWRAYLLDHLLGSKEGVRSIFHEFEADPKLGIVYPPAYPLIAPYADWGGNEERCRTLLREMDCDADLPSMPDFPVGNMFWARGAAIKPMLEYSWKYDQFEPEEGQVSQTLPHAIERIWGYCATGRGYHAQEIFLKRPLSAAPHKRRLAFYVHYEPQALVSDADLFYLEELRKVVSEIIVITNNRLPAEEHEKLRAYANEIVQRTNVGFDFGAWRDGIRKVGWAKLACFDEIVLANNSCYGPVFPFAEMFADMAGQACDFWSVTAFPRLTNSSRAEARLLPGNTIPMHLQSYFMVFGKPVFDSPEFKDFWELVENKTDILEVVAEYETQLTESMVAAGFKWACYLRESLDLQARNGSIAFNAIYNQPVEMLLLRSPLIKKKVLMYAPDQTALLKHMVGCYGLFPANLMFPEP